MSEVAAQLLELARADLTLETDPALVRPVDVPVLRGDAARLRAATGWQPQSSRSRRRSPTSWPRGRRTDGERRRRDAAVLLRRLTRWRI